MWPVGSDAIVHAILLDAVVGVGAGWRRPAKQHQASTCIDAANSANVTNDKGNDPRSVRNNAMVGCVGRLGVSALGTLLDTLPTLESAWLDAANNEEHLTVAALAFDDVLMRSFLLTSTSPATVRSAASMQA